jgi:NADP-dependent 3-hydroxy acid dehydrogenase YdfG
VTGGASGIGFAVAQMLSAQGFGLTLVGRSAERLTMAARALGGQAHIQTVAADLAEAEAASVVVDQHLERFETLDLLVASAGQSKRGTVADTPSTILRRLFSVNVEGTFSLVARALPALRRTGGASPSWVVLLSSMAAHWPVDEFAAYSATKAAIASLARSISAEEAQNGVRACALCPGFVDTELSAPLAEIINPAEMISPADIAEAVRFLLALSDTATVTELTISRVGAAPLRP